MKAIKPKQHSLTQLKLLTLGNKIQLPVSVPGPITIPFLLLITRVTHIYSQQGLPQILRSSRTDTPPTSRALTNTHASLGYLVDSLDLFLSRIKAYLVEYLDSSYLVYILQNTCPKPYLPSYPAAYPGNTYLAMKQCLFPINPCTNPCFYTHKPSINALIQLPKIKQNTRYITKRIKQVRTQR